ncbi:MAG: radical SAM protein [Elusimicrobia bacterium]|nr:radical SAM protein [Elusimicrobiota bacterium]
MAGTRLSHDLRRVYWEVTAGCNLRCIHCRRTDVLTQGAPEELTTEEAKKLIQDLALMGGPVLVFSGGEPLFRKDILEIAAYARARGLPVAMATNGTLVRKEVACAIKEAGIYYASISLDGAKPATHDAFRGLGNFERALRGFLHLQEVGIKVQINFTVTRGNVHELSEMVQLANSFGACALYLFLLVPVGCGVQIADSQMLSPQEVERWLLWVFEDGKKSSLPIKAICAPHYYRVEKEDGRSAPEDAPLSRKGCLAGIHMCFVSHKGEVFPCGYLPVSAGNVRRKSLQDIWESSQVFDQLRDANLLTGRCGACPYKVLCGGCRARAYYTHGDVLAEEPYCTYPSPTFGSI